MAQLNIEMGMNDGAAFKPVSIAPDVSYGVTDDLTLALVHSNAAISGFRGSAGAGLCITGTANGCPYVYHDVGIEALYSVLRGPFAIALDGGVLGLDLRPQSPAVFDLDLKLGAKMKYTAGRVYVLFSPSVWIGLTNRTVERMGMSADVNLDQLWLPVSVWLKATPELDVGLATGIKGPLATLGDSFTVPLGVLVNYAITKQVAVGTSWVFGKVLGGDANVDMRGNKTTGFDARSWHVWLTLKM